MPLPVSPMPDSTVAAGATAAAPASGTVIATFTPPLGVYSLRITTQETGTVDANAANINLKSQNAVVGPLPSTGAVTSTVIDRVSADGTHAIQLVVGASAGGAGSIYVGSIVATLVDTNVSTAGNAANYR